MAETRAGVLSWRTGLSAFFVSAGAGLRTTTLIMFAVLVINWGFLLLELSQFGSLSRNALAIGGLAFGTGAFVLVFGVLIPVLFFPLANFHAARVAARRLYEEHRGTLDQAIHEIVSSSASDAVRAGAAKMRLDAQNIAAHLRELPAPAAIMVRIALGKGGVEEWVQKIEGAAQHDDPVSGTAELLQAAVHEALEPRIATGMSARLVKIAFTLNLLLIAAAAFLVA